MILRSFFCSFALIYSFTLAAQAQPDPVAVLDVGSFLNGARFDATGDQIMTFESGQIRFRDPATGLEEDALPDLGGGAYPSYFAESPDGTLWAQWVITDSDGRGYNEAKLVLIDAATRTVLSEFEMPDYGSYAFSPDNSEIATGIYGYVSPIEVRSTSDGGLLRTEPVPELRIRHIQLAPSGTQWLVAGSVDTNHAAPPPNPPLFLIDRTTGERTFPEPVGAYAEYTSYTQYPAFSPDGTQVLSAGEGASALHWDLTSNVLTAKYASDTPGVSQVATTAWSADGSKVAVSYYFRGLLPEVTEVRIFDTATEASLHTFSFKGIFSAVSFFTEATSGAERLMVTAEGALYLIDPNTGAMVLEKEDFGVGYDAYAFSPDGEKYAAIGHDRVDLLLVASNFAARGDLGSASPRPIAFPDNNTFLTAEPDGSIRRISLFFGSTIETFPVHGQQARRLLVDRANNRVLSYAPYGSVDETFLWSLDDGSILADYPGLRLNPYSYTDSAFSPSGNHILNESQLYSVNTGEIGLSVRKDHSYAALGFGKTGNLTDYSSIPDAARLPASTYSGWQTQLSLSDARVTPDGLVLVAPFTVYEEVQIYGSPTLKNTYGLSFWDTTTGDLISYHHPFTNSFLISPDGRYLASGTEVWSIADLLASGGGQP